MTEQAQRSGKMLLLSPWTLYWHEEDESEADRAKNAPSAEEVDEKSEDQALSPTDQKYATVATMGE